MNGINYTMQEAVKLALDSLNTEDEFKIKGVSPKEVGDYLEDVLGFEFSDIDYDKPDDSVFCRYVNYEDETIIILDWNGWTGKVWVSGYTLDFLSDN